jgi:hypothetical protein
VEFLVGFLGRWAGAVGNDFLDDFGGSIGGWWVVDWTSVIADWVGLLVPPLNGMVIVVLEDLVAEVQVGMVEFLVGFLGRCAGASTRGDWISAKTACAVFDLDWVEQVVAALAVKAEDLVAWECNKAHKHP